MNMLVKKICEEFRTYVSVNCEVCRREIIILRKLKRKKHFCDVCSYIKKKASKSNMRNFVEELIEFVEE